MAYPTDLRCGLCDKRCGTRTELNRHEAECEKAERDRREQERRDDILADKLSEELLR